MLSGIAVSRPLVLVWCYCKSEDKEYDLGARLLSSYRSCELRLASTSLTGHLIIFFSLRQADIFFPKASLRHRLFLFGTHRPVRVRQPPFRKDFFKQTFSKLQQLVSRNFILYFLFQYLFKQTKSRLDLVLNLLLELILHPRGNYAPEGQYRLTYN